MKIGPLELRRYERVAVEAAATNGRVQTEIGASGSNNLDGFLIDSEYNPDLRGKEALRVFDRMLRSDDSVTEAAGHIVAPVLNGTVEIQPAGEELEDLEVAAAVEKLYSDWLSPGWGWQQHLDEALDFLFFGHYVFETVWHVVEDELEIEDPSLGTAPPPEGGPQQPQKRTLPRRQFLTPKRFDPRLPHTIFKWNEREGDLFSITQNVLVEGKPEEPEIPADRLLVFTCNRRGHEWTGRSLLRPAYKPWVFKEMIEKVSGIAVEKHGVGTWVGYLPPGRENDKAMVDRVENMLRDARSGAQAYMVAPFPKQQAATNDAGGLFEIVTPSTGIPDFTGLLEYFRGAIKGAMLVRFSELGHGSVGARATGDVQSEVWYDALHAVARYIEDVHSEAIRRFVRANFQIQRYPKLKFADIESRSLEEYAKSIAVLVSSGAVSADTPARAAIRKAVDLPPEEEAPEMLAQPPAPPATTPEPAQIEEDPTGPPTQAATESKQQRAARWLREAHVPVVPGLKVHLGGHDFGGTIGETSAYDAAGNRVLWSGPLSSQQDKRALYHEAGHAFSAKFITADDRPRIRRLIGGKRKNNPWDWNRDPNEPGPEPFEEIWADVYADLAMTPGGYPTLRAFLRELASR